MVDLAQIDLLLCVGVLVAIVAIGCGIRGVYSIAASPWRDRINQSTTALSIPSQPHKSQPSDEPTEERGKAA